MWRGSYPARAMICAPSRSASRSYSRLELHEVGAEPDLRPLGDHGAGSAADHRSHNLARERAELKLLALGRLCGTVPQHDVADLVRDHAGDLALASRGLEHAAVHEDRSSRERERIDVFAIDDLERVAKLRLAEPSWNRCDEPRPDALDGVLGPAIADDRHFLAEFRCRAPSQFDVLGGRESIAVRIDACLRTGRERYRHAGCQCQRQPQSPGCAVGYVSHADWFRNLEASTDRAKPSQKRPRVEPENSSGVLVVGQL